MTVARTSKVVKRVKSCRAKKHDSCRALKFYPAVIK